MLQEGRLDYLNALDTIAPRQHSAGKRFSE
jgi:hypothetical protein